MIKLETNILKFKFNWEQNITKILGFLKVIKHSKLSIFKVETVHNLTYFEYAVGNKRK